MIIKVSIVILISLEFSQKNLKNREFESLKPRVWRKIAAKKTRVREIREFGTASLRGISVCRGDSYNLSWYENGYLIHFRKLGGQ